MEISVKYQGKEVYISRQETSYGSNVEGFVQMLNLVLTGIGLEVDGTIKEMEIQR